MAYDYDALYAAQQNALGEPTCDFVSFFETYGHANSRVLDVGCGQGRDALFIARQGHHVVGVDLSAHGIADLTKAAAAENLDIEGIVADITEFAPHGVFDVLLIDRTLHMLDAADQSAVLETLIGHVAPHGWLLIADENSNHPRFHAVLEGAKQDWRITRSGKGYLFAQSG
jgi:2-polyprenyl-3-methyl-5-hydroxy-6-metoxy-1,4-benzoquinol methylase